MMTCRPINRQRHCSIWCVDAAMIALEDRQGIDVQTHHRERCSEGQCMDIAACILTDQPDVSMWIQHRELPCKGCCKDSAMFIDWEPPRRLHGDSPQGAPLQRAVHGRCRVRSSGPGRLQPQGLPRDASATAHTAWSCPPQAGPVSLMRPLPQNPHLPVNQAMGVSITARDL